MNKRLEHIFDEFKSAIRPTADLNENFLEYFYS